MSVDTNKLRELAGKQRIKDLDVSLILLCAANEFDAQAAQIAQLRESLRKAEQLTQVCGDWNLDEIEIDGEMIDTLDLRNEFRAALAQEQGGSDANGDR
ncbi:hypothetical protein KVP10_08335 [Candidimonas humi]|uniref:Uncharacterized protein n=1 Tax=Candidimonas humi TaxID=683355 RepID=A0ABV8NW30_9BURK|nr:hypothetical protein [Candidimonas humi]MBV6304893.1 hypothetical protein [Candidimonas humi]